MVNLQFQVDPDKEFAASVKKARARVGDLTIPFTLISKSWFQSNKSIFSLAGPGKYVDLKPSTKATKLRVLGTVYPILRFSGALESSLTDPGDSKSIAKIENKKVLFLGSSISYLPYLQFGTKFMAARPVILLGPEQVAPSGINKRREAWIAILRSYVEQVTGEAFE